MVHVREDHLVRIWADDAKVVSRGVADALGQLHLYVAGGASLRVGRQELAVASDLRPEGLVARQKGLHGLPPSMLHVGIDVLDLNVLCLGVQLLQHLVDRESGVHALLNALGDLGTMGLQQRHRHRDEPADKAELGLAAVHVALAHRDDRLAARVLEALLHPARELHVCGRPLLVAAAEDAEAHALQRGLGVGGVEPLVEFAGVVRRSPIVHAGNNDDDAVRALGQRQARGHLVQGVLLHRHAEPPARRRRAVGEVLARAHVGPVEDHQPLPLQLLHVSDVAHLRRGGCCQRRRRG
mmetsp:Transcript_78300/g.204090  ORF Transcript_78300/g.204090 Transcript_78300/m.204090 type:complete len:296 (-) Transcript_78300:425-1312(-)